MSDQPSQNNTSKLWKNKSFLVWFIVLSFIGLVGYGLFFWSAGQNEQLTNQIQQHESRIDQLKEQHEILMVLTETDGQVILKGEYAEALDFYQSLRNRIDDSLRISIDARISEMKDILQNRSNDNGPDPKEMMLNRYRKNIKELEFQTDSLQMAMQVQKTSLSQEIENLNSDLARKERALEKKERIEVISFPSINDAKVQYLGEVENGKANGGGVGIWSTGSVYRGDWKNNRRHGQGTFEWADGEVYEGTFVEGRREGQGKYYWPSGERYEGEWVNNRRNGHGKLFDMDGNIRYEGEWKEDKPVEK